MKTTARHFEPLCRCRDVEDFEKSNCIGEGTYGTVYRARDRTTQQVVALKRLQLHNEVSAHFYNGLYEVDDDSESADERRAGALQTHVLEERVEDLHRAQHHVGADVFEAVDEASDHAFQHHVKHQEAHGDGGLRPGQHVVEEDDHSLEHEERRDLSAEQ
ncbi:hypothetical protein BBJ28_00016066 [Nothophytophthora sp. Chile5]|nr:hypothetical protein BBJ28_00016066 [Nothophytophthora sp. Chile5]